MSNHQQKGFSLVELMVVVVVVSILMGIGIPSYRGYMMRVNRVDATSALLRIAAAQEKFYLQSNPARYATTAAELTNPPPAGLGIGATERGYYVLTVAANVPGGAAVGYTVTATVDGGEGQAADDACDVFTMTEQGTKHADDSGGSANTEACWR